MVSVDSRDRDVDHYPLQNEYSIRMPSEYRSIKQIKLLSAEFCNMQYAITSKNNRIVYSEDAAGAPLLTGISSFLKEGNYTGSQFAAEIQSTINHDLFIAGSAATIEVSFDVTTRKMTYIDKHPLGVFTFLFDTAKAVPIGATPSQYYAPHADGTPYVGGDNFMWREMGFTDLAVDQIVSADATLPTVSPNMAYIFRDRYVIMEIASPKIISGAMRTTRPHYEVFAKIVFDDEPGNLFGNFYHFVSSPMEFHRVMRLTDIAFRFKRPDGDLVDFHNHEHSFTLEILTG